MATDRIGQPWGVRTPYGPGERWPARVDMHLAEGVSEHEVDTWAERVGRLKLNGRLRGYSPLSRFVELEFLLMGIEGKKQLWTTLRDLAELDSRLPKINFDELIARAERQRTVLEPFRARTGREVFGAASAGGAPPPQK